MKIKENSIMLAVMLCLGAALMLTVILCLGAAPSYAAVSGPEETPEAEEAAAASESAAVCEDDGLESDTDQPEDDDGNVIGSGLPEGAAPYGGEDGDDALPDPEETPEASHDGITDAESVLTVVGDGAVEVREGSNWVDFYDWIKTADLPANDVRFRAVPSQDSEIVTGVTVDLEPVPFEKNADDDAWLFTVEVLGKDSSLVVSFGDTIPGVVTIVGPGTAWLLSGTVWAEIPSEQPVFEGVIGDTVSILAQSDDTAYSVTELWIGNTAVAPIRYTNRGAVFEFKVEGPIMDLAIAFEEHHHITADISGVGTVSVGKEDKWIVLEDGANYPYDSSEVSKDAPLSFRAVPGAGYIMGQVRFAGTELAVTGGAARAAGSGWPEMRAKSASRAEADDEPLLMPIEDSGDPYLFAVSDPVNNGVLSVSFVNSDNSEVQWLRGSDVRTGISWAIPLGDSVYGASNVTPGSNIQITPLTQGAQYDQARTLAARFGSEFKAWDFTLLNEAGVAYEPTVPALFSLPIPAGYPQSQKYLRMLHIRTDGQIMECPLEVRTDSVSGMVYISTKADTLSTFILVNTLSANGVSTPVPTYSAPAGQGGSGAGAGGGSGAGASAAPTKAPGTDDQSSIWFLVLCAAAAAAAVGCAGMAVRRTSGR